jgi:hypothetical protein
LLIDCERARCSGRYSSECWEGLTARSLVPFQPMIEEGKKLAAVRRDDLDPWGEIRTA